MHFLRGHRRGGALGLQPHEFEKHDGRVELDVRLVLVRQIAFELARLAVARIIELESRPE